MKLLPFLTLVNVPSEFAVAGQTEIYLEIRASFLGYRIHGDKYEITTLIEYSKLDIWTSANVDMKAVAPIIEKIVFDHYRELIINHRTKSSKSNTL